MSDNVTPQRPLRTQQVPGDHRPRPALPLQGVQVYVVLLGEHPVAGSFEVTLRRQLLNVPARLASSGRRLVAPLPTYWPWQNPWQNLWHTSLASTGPPAPVTP